MGRTWLFPQVRWNSRSAQRLRRGDAIEVTGVAFFDFLHQQRGAAANGLELYPVLRIAPLSAVARVVASSARQR